jgi:hypothetical protein
MNNKRRSEIRRARAMIIEAKEIIESCVSEEEDYRDAMPENMRDGEKAQRVDDDIENLGMAVESLEAADQSLEGIVE